MVKMSKDLPEESGWYWWTEKKEYTPTKIEVLIGLEVQVESFYDSRIRFAYQGVSAVGGYWGKVPKEDFEYE